MTSPPAYPLRIGVTGHRNLQQPSEVTQAVERGLTELQTRLTGAQRSESPWRRFIRKSDGCLAPDEAINFPAVHGD